MSSIAKTSISLSKKDLAKSRISPVGFRNVVFYHKATAAQSTINLMALTLPSAEMPTVVQATTEELGSARLIVNKKNLKLTSSMKGDLIQGLDYIVADSTTILLIGPYETIGAEVDEIFVGVIVQAPVSDLVVASSKNVVRSYTLPVGQNTLNLAHEFKVNEFSSENIGIIKLFVNGVLALRNTGNSSISLDKDYYEVDSGNGFGSTVYFNVAPIGTVHEIVVDFGVQAITDFNAIGMIESLSGSVKKIADDLAVVAGTTVGDYLNANPSDVERRGFGDQVLDHEVRLDAAEIAIDAVELAIPLKADLNGSALNLFSVANAVSSSNAVALGQFGASLTANGYQKLPSGLIMQWGQATGGSAAGQTVTFPIPFLSAVFQITTSKTDTQSTFETSISSTTLTNFVLVATPGGSGTGIITHWFAVGY
jgi:hypothetical protein